MRTLFFALVPCAAALAQEAPKDFAIGDEQSTTQHRATIGGEEVAFTATAGYLTIPSYDGKPRASMFHIAYTKDGVEDRSQRPVTFAFNGGPGSSSVWLHMGALGPVRVVMGPEGEPLAPPHRYTANEWSWLDLTDLVFIDPISTGYSRPADGQDAAQFHGLEGDLDAVAEFIRLWTTRHQRWGSPKFLAGESYGTTRAAAIADLLQDSHGMEFNGIVLISPVLDFQTLRFNEGNDTPYWLYLPTYCATAWYHKQLAPELQGDLRATLDAAERFATGDYLLALARGDALPDEERRRIAAELARFTGLDEEYILNSRLRPRIFNFTKELLRHRGTTVGRLDSRYTGLDGDGVGDSTEYDPSYAAILGVYTACLNDYMRGPLNYKNDHPYEILTGRVHPWSYRSFEGSYVNVAPRLRDAMSKNRALHVLFCSGYYDLATPHFAVQYTAEHLGLDPSLRGNIHKAFYESGHMMYVRLADLEKLKSDVTSFYRTALRARR